ncbi:MAG: enoyl-CoA hydratase-related protein, partial [Ginsengibacter sp.]
MKILFIVTSFNSLSQRAWVELDRLNHQVKVHIASSPELMIDAVNEYEPGLIIAPYLRSKIPEIIWTNYTCFIVHPGIVGDRGSSSLDWAILNDEKEWGVTIVQAVEKMDAGPLWATENFRMRAVSKSFLYRHEVTQAAIRALLKAVELFEEKNFATTTSPGKWARSTNENDFKFSWDDDTSTIFKKINAADSFPGALSNILGNQYYCYGVEEEAILKGLPGELLAKRNNSVCVATSNAALWIKCLKKYNEPDAVKLPAEMVLGDKARDVAESPLNIFEDKLSVKTFREIWYEESDGVGYLHFDFYNGAMSTEQCMRLKDAFVEARDRTTKLIVLMGGRDIWSNGIHLNLIEAAENPAEASWGNINAIDDLIKEIISTDTHYIISALQGNAGAGGVSLALAADKVIAASGVVLNPHTRNMGLYGSEYWTYLLPKRIGTERANLFTEQCLPWGTAIALEVKLIDDCIEESGDAFCNSVKKSAEEIVALPY